MSAKHHTDQHCQHISLRGQRCRMLRAADHVSLCRHHLRQVPAAQPDTEALAAELLGSLDDFSTADSVNQLLGNLVKQLARKRIERLDAIALAYICQLLLNSLSPLKKELRAEGDEQARINDEKLQAELQAWARRKGRPDDSNDLVPQAVPTLTLDRPSWSPNHNQPRQACCETLNTFPSGSLNHATLLPSGVVQIPRSLS